MVNSLSRSFHSLIHSLSLSLSFQFHASVLTPFIPPPPPSIHFSQFFLSFFRTPARPPSFLLRFSFPDSNNNSLVSFSFLSIFSPPIHFFSSSSRVHSPIPFSISSLAFLFRLARSLALSFARSFFLVRFVLCFGFFVVVLMISILLFSLLHSLSLMRMITFIHSLHPPAPVQALASLHCTLLVSLSRSLALSLSRFVRSISLLLVCFSLFSLC